MFKQSVVQYNENLMVSMWDKCGSGSADSIQMLICIKVIGYAKTLWPGRHLISLLRVSLTQPCPKARIKIKMNSHSFGKKYWSLFTAQEPLWSCGFWLFELLYDLMVTAFVTKEILDTVLFLLLQPNRSHNCSRVSKYWQVATYGIKRI